MSDLSYEFLLQAIANELTVTKIIGVIVTTIISNGIPLIMSLPQRIIRIANWKYRKIYDSILVYKIKDESLKSFIKRVSLMALDAFLPFIFLFLTANVIISKVIILEMVKLLGGYELIIFFILLISFVLLSVIEWCGKENDSRIKSFKWITFVISIDILIFPPMLMLELSVNDIWFIYEINYLLILFVWFLISRHFSVLKYNLPYVKVSKGIRMLILILLPVLVYKQEILFRYFIWVWIIMWYIEYFLYILGVGITGKNVTIHFEDSTDITQKRILQCKGDLIKYTRIDDNEVLIKENEVKYISYECDVLRIKIPKKVKVTFRKGDKECIFDAVNYINNKWAAFNTYDGNKKYVIIRKIKEIYSIENQSQ